MTFMADEPDDPTIVQAKGPVAGLVPGAGPKNVVLVEGIGVSPMITARNGPDGELDESTIELQLALSITGRRNQTEDLIHHAYSLKPSTVGLLLAQIVSMLGAFEGDEIESVYKTRLEQIRREQAEKNGE